MNATESVDLGTELEESRQHLLLLADRVKKLVAKRNEREILVQQFRQAAGTPDAFARKNSSGPAHFCSLCASSHASEHVEHVRACAPGTKCDDCGQPAVMSLEIKADIRRREMA
jgi:hypothetical protein